MDPEDSSALHFLNSHIQPLSRPQISHLRLDLFQLSKWWYLLSYKSLAKRNSNIILEKTNFWYWHFQTFIIFYW